MDKTMIRFYKDMVESIKEYKFAREHAGYIPTVELLINDLEEMISVLEERIQEVGGEVEAEMQLPEEK